ncbi:hypothetical protein SNEBB_006486 [Seison nebaliae]|nr:hypothetical protein SNEBB_006486 [Seison nebaliae]
MEIVSEDLFDTVKSGKGNAFGQLMKTAIQSSAANSILSSVNADSVEANDPEIQSEADAEASKSTTGGFVASTAAGSDETSSVAEDTTQAPGNTAGAR